MTVIAARRDETTGDACIGGDRRMVEDSDRICPGVNKVWRSAGAVFAGAGNWAFLQRLRRWLGAGHAAIESRAAVLAFAEEMVARLAADEFAGHRPAIDLLVVTADGLWMLDGDGVVMECPPWGYAIGSGAKEAAAVLYDRREEAAAVAVQRALDVACARVTTCGDGTNLYRVQFVGQVLQEVVS